VKHEIALSVAQVSGVSPFFSKTGRREALAAETGRTLSEKRPGLPAYDCSTVV
jgi:hypothetical protein